MSYYINAYACTDNTSKNYQKHLKALKFCIDNNLSLPKETRDYFQDAFEEDIEDYGLDYILEEVEEGFRTFLGSEQQYFEIDMKDIPKDTKKIIIGYS